jgi:hypothetical protein
MNQSHNLAAVLFIGLFSMIHDNSYSQKASFFQKKQVFINKSNPDYKVKFINTKNDVIKKHTEETYNAAGVLISYQLTDKLDWSKSQVADNTNPNMPSFIKNEIYLFADIKPDEGRLLVYFWPWEDDGTNASLTAANTFYKAHTFSIEVEDRVNLSFKSTAFQISPLTLPLKVYLGGPDSISKVSASANIGFCFGKKFGHTKYVKIPDEKEFMTYETSHSWNIVLGINKLDLDDKNTKDDGKKFQGSIAAITTAFAYGIHLKNFSLFTAFGFDHPIGKGGKLWSLKGKPWFGFGGGFDIF